MISEMIRHHRSEALEIPDQKQSISGKFLIYRISESIFESCSTHKVNFLFSENRNFLQQKQKNLK